MTYDGTLLRHGIVAALTMLALSGWPGAAHAQESARCRRTRATAESQAYLLVSPSLWVEGVHVPRVGDETGAGLIVGGEYQLRAALSWSPLDVARGVLVMEQASSECALIDAATRVREVLELGDAVGELAARRSERQVLSEAEDEIASLLAHAEAQVDAGVGTRSQLAGIRSEALRLSRRAAQLDAEIAALLEAGHGEAVSAAGLEADLDAYEARALDLESDRSTLRRLSPFTVGLRGGVLPGDRVDWFGQVQVGINLGVIAQNIAEDALLEARRDELRDDADELRAHATRFVERLQVSLPGLRQELAHIDALIAVQNTQRELLEGLDSSEVDGARALNALLSIGLAAERAHLATLIAERERAVGDAGDTHADE